MKLFLILLLAFSPGALAQGWPAKQVRFILPNSAGSGPDVVARLAAESLERILRQPFIVDNRPGGNFFIAAEAIAKANPDGYTIGMGSAAMLSINPNLFRSLPYDPERDFEYIGVVIDTIWGFFGVHPSVPARTFAEFIDLAKKSPGKFTFGVTVPVNGMWTKWVMKRAGVQLTQVDYKTQSQAVQDGLAGRVDAITNSFAGYETFLKDGRLRGLVAITDTRHPDWPGLQPITDFFPGTGFDSWIGIVAPRGVPEEMVQSLNRAIDTVVRDPEFARKTHAVGWSNREGARTPRQIAERVRVDRQKWAEIVREAGVKPE